MILSSFDELNIPFNSESYIVDFFKPMRISKEQKEERQRAARDFRDYLLDLFLFLGIQSEYLAVNWETIETEMQIAFERAAMKYADNTVMLRKYIADKAFDFVRITRENIDNGSYWLSDERATYEAVNEANEVIGCQEYQDAIDRGCKWKTWLTQRDNRVRKSHREVDGKKIPIDDYFILEKGILLYAGDYYNCPDEVVNCRCYTKYS